MARMGVEEQLAISILNGFTDSKMVSRELPTEVVDLLLDQIKDQNLSYIQHLTAQPSHRYQLAQISKTSPRSLFLAEQSTDEQILAKLMKRSAVSIKRQLALNPNLPPELLQLLINWACARKEPVTLHNLTKVTPLLKIMASPIAELTEVDLVEEALAQRLANECTPEVAELALRLENPRILAQLAIATYQKRSGDLTLTDLITTANKLSQLDRAPIRLALQNLILTSSEITDELLEVATTWSRKLDLADESWDLDYYFNTLPAPLISEQTLESILGRANEPSFTPAGAIHRSKGKPVLSLYNSWSPLEVVTLRMAASPALTPELFTAILKITQIQGAYYLLKNKALKISSEQIDELLEVVGRELQVISADLRQYLEGVGEVSNILLSNYDLTGKQSLIAHMINGDDSANWMVSGTLSDWSQSRNPLNLAFIKALTELPDEVPYFILTLDSDSFTRDKVVSWFLTQTSFAISDGLTYGRDEQLLPPEHTLNLTPQMRELLIKVAPTSALINAIDFGNRDLSTDTDFLKIGDILTQRLGNRLDKWQLLLSLLPSWKSYLPELLEMVDSLTQEQSLKPTKEE